MKLLFIPVAAFLSTFICGVFTQSTKHFPNDTIRVRLLIYSGREDPTWSVSPFSRLYRNISYLMQRPTPSPQNSFPRLGYNGFDVAMPGVPTRTIPARSNPALESMLLYSGRQYIDESTYRYVLSDIHR